MAKTDYNSIIRNKIRDFIGSKKWSVSRFASRYVEEFAKHYGKMEAPSTSTSRKLVEEDGHIYTEREVTVLDSFTNMDFYQTWLEGEKAKVIELSNRYLSTDNGGTSIDSPAMLRDSIAKLSRKGVNITLDDIDDLLRRFVALDSKAPFILFSPSWLLMQAVLRLISPRHEIVKVNPENATEEIKTLIETAAQGKKVIGRILADSTKLPSSISEIFGKDVFLLRFLWSKPMAESFYRKSRECDPEKRAYIAKRIKSCLAVREDWSELFKRMVETGVESKWVKLPDNETPGEWMEFLELKYHQLASSLCGGILENELRDLVDTRLPEDWFIDNCNPIALLQCRLDYKTWKASKEESIAKIEDNQVRKRQLNAIRQFECTDYEALMLWGNTSEIECPDWKTWFDERFRHYLVDFDFNKLLDLSYAYKQHRQK